MKNKVLFISLLLLSGCGTIVNSSEEKITFKSTSLGSTIVVKDKENQIVASGESPLVVTLNKEHRPTYLASVVSKKGVTEIEKEIRPAISSWFWINIPLNAGLGMLLDVRTGGMWTFKNDEIQLAMDKKDDKPKSKKNPLCQPVSHLKVLAVQDKYALLNIGNRKAFIRKDAKTVYYDDMIISIPEGKCVAFVDSRKYTDYSGALKTYYDEKETKSGTNKHSEQVQVQGERIETLPVIAFVPTYVSEASDKKVK